MNARIDHFLHALLELSSEERSAVAAALVDSLSDESDASISDDWRQELLLRRDAFRAGRSSASAWSDVRSRLSAL
jgi:putative addiction module component (TIGR02574 family)